MLLYHFKYFNINLVNQRKFKFYFHSQFSIINIILFILKLMLTVHFIHFLIYLYLFYMIIQFILIYSSLMNFLSLIIHIILKFPLK
jgi:hypothetical protein